MQQLHVCFTHSTIHQTSLTHSHCAHRLAYSRSVDFLESADVEPELTKHSMHHANTDAYPRTFKLNLLNKSQQVKKFIYRRLSYTQHTHNSFDICVVIFLSYSFVVGAAISRRDYNFVNSIFIVRSAIAIG